jgi:hypothetical protein
MRMPQKQAHQLFANVTRSADYSDLHLAAAADSRLWRFFHKAQCVFRFDLIATKHCQKILARDAKPSPRRLAQPSCILDG